MIDVTTSHAPYGSIPYGALDGAGQFAPQLFGGGLLGSTLGGLAGGALGGKLSDVGINDQFMRDVAKSLDSGHAALFLLIRKMTTDKVMTELQGTGGTIMRSSFDETKEQVLREALTGAQAAAAATAPVG